MDFKTFIRLLQKKLNEKGESLTVDGDPGPKTQAALSKYDVEIDVKLAERPEAPQITGRVENPSYLEAKKYAGAKESDSKFGAFLSKFWPKTGLNYKTIVGSSFAWCALFVVAMQSETGQKYIASAAAKSHAKTGVEIAWKEDGIPRGAIIHLNHSKCGSGSGNHVTFADGDCTAADLKKAGATFAGFGGNQGNAVKRSIYGAGTICAVRWPSEVPKPGPIQKSVNCTGAGSSGESTR